MDVSHLATNDGAVGDDVDRFVVDEKDSPVDQSIGNDKVVSHGRSQQLLDKIDKLEQRLREAENHIGISPLSSLTPWRYSHTGAGPAGSSAQRTDDNNNDKMNSEIFKLTQGMYTVLSVWEWNTKPFWASLFVVLIQITLLAVLIVDLIGGAAEGNILNLPGNVEYTVRIAQAVAVPIAVFKQEDLREGIEYLFQGMPHAFRGDIKFQSMTPGKWRFGYFLRFAQGFLSMFASFVLLLQAETVFDLLLNFLGIEFISDLDELSFRLAGLGYFGITTMDCVNTISETEFRKDKEETDIAAVTFSPSWCRKYAHILGVFFVFVAMVSSFIFYSVQQYDGEYLPSIVQVEFGDETVPYLGIFNGCYMARHDEIIAERFVFEQMGRSTLQGKLAYCRDLDDGSWVLFYGEDNDSCEKNYIVSSGSTKAFDVQETVESQWYTNTGLPLEYLQIYEVDEESSSCGSLELLDDTLGSCLEIELDLEGRSRTFQKRQLSASSEGKVYDSIRSHPIYVSADGSESEVVTFTGRRWVLANSSKIGSWENTTTLLDDTGNENFYEGLMKADSGWILSISEPVDGVNDQGTPLGLQWYFPRDAGEESNTTVTFNFQMSDLTRPVGLACATCNSKTNPCLYEGVCTDETGKCDCKNGASGKLCRERPSGDGTCNAYFNTLEFGYDSGDCCASTCGVSACDDSRIAFPYGLDVLSKKGNESRAVWFEPHLGLGLASSAPKAFGYDECKDPDQATFTIEIKPTYWAAWATLITSLSGFDDDFDWGASFFCTVDTIVLTCDGKPYMDISLILVATIGDIEECPTFRQAFQVPYGASCEISYSNVMYTISQSEFPLNFKLFHGSDGSPFYEDVSAIDSYKQFGWETPASKCITEAFSNATKSIFDKRTIEGAAVDRLSASWRAIEWCESENEDDRDTLFERFALEALLTMLGSTETFHGEAHHCTVPIVGEILAVKCNSDDKVISLEIPSNRNTTNVTLQKFLGFLPLLPQLQDLYISGNILTGPIPANEISKLHNLVFLGLVGGNLTGTIPTEIFSLQKLEQVFFSDNTLTGSIPTEIGRLTKLRAVGLENNNLIGPAFPSELLSLRGLIGYLASNNRLDGSIPVEVERLERLNKLYLERNLLTGTIPTEIGNLKDLMELTLSNNRLNGSIPLEVENLSNLLVCNILSGNSNMTGGSVGICT